MTNKPKPTHNAFVVTEYTVGTEKRSLWHKIGAAFTHKDGLGIDVLLEAFPVSGRLTLRVPRQGDDASD